MNPNSEKIIINIKGNQYLHWKSYLKKKLNEIKTNNLEIDCRNLDLSCIDIVEIIEIARQHNCKITSFCSSSSKTIISAQSLGYRSQFIIENYSKNNLKINHKNLNFTKTHFHQGTVRSGEYLDIPGDLLILGDVNPGAIVSAEENIIIWGRLLGIAHAGNKGNTQATISALQLKPVQIRIANKIAKGPKGQPQHGFPEQAKIYLEEIIISPLESV